MTKRISDSAVSGTAGRTVAALLCFSTFLGLGAPWTARAQDQAAGAPAALEVRLFEGTGFSGAMRSVLLEPGKPYAYIERFGDEKASAVRSLRAGTSVGVALFRHAFFMSQDESCAPTLGSDEKPDLIWTGQTADFLPAKAGSSTVAALSDAGAEGYASAILYHRDAGPPPGLLLMKRRRSYGRGCGNILRSFNFDRRFFPLEYATGASDAATPSGCFNLKGASGDKSPVTDMQRSDRVALLQPSDLDRRYGEKERRFQVRLFDGENCGGESVTLQAPVGAAGKAATAADNGERRDILLSSLLFRDRTQSLRVEALDRAGRSIVHATAASKTEKPVSSTASSTAATAKKKADQPAAKALASRAQEDPPVRKEPAPEPTAVQTAPSAKAATPQAPVQKSVAPSSSTLKAPDPTPKILPQTTAAGTPKPEAALPTAKLDPMTKLPPAVPAPAAPEVASRKPQTDAIQAPAARGTNSAPEGAAAPVQPQLTQVQPPIRAEEATPAQTPPVRSAAPRAQLSQSQAAPQGAAQEPSSADGGEPGTQVFTFPVYDVYRLNFCLSTKGQCGEPAANKWCQMKGFERAVAWRKDNNIGGLFPTFLIGDEQICAQYKCDGFAQITCGR